MSLPRVGLVHAGTLEALVPELVDRVEAVEVAPDALAGIEVAAWVVGTPGLAPEVVQRVRDGQVPTLFVVDRSELRAWARVLRKGVHDVAVFPLDVDEVRARLQGLIARQSGWTEVSGALSRELAHDLRGPLQALQLTVMALQSDGAVAAGFQEDVDALLEAVDLADLMLDGVANLGRRPVARPEGSVDLVPVLRKIGARPAFGGKVSVSAGEALPVAVAADVLQAIVEDAVRVVWIRASGKREVSATALRLGQDAVLTVQGKAYAALLDHLPALLSRERPILLRRQRVPMPLAGLAYAQEVAVAAGGDVTVRRADADMVVELRLPLAR